MISKACVVGIYQRKLEEIARLGVTLTVVVPPGWRDERGYLPLERLHTDGYALRITPIGLNGSFHLHYYPRLRRILAEAQPDIVHIDEEPYNLATRQAMRLARTLGARTLFFTWQNLHRRYPPPFGWWEQRAYRQAAYAIAGNQDALRVLRAKGYAGPAAVIPQFGVEPSLYTAATPPSGGPAIIGYIGRLIPDKGVDDLLRATAGLRGNWQLRLLGSGPELGRLASLAQAFRIEERVSFDGQIPSGQVPAYLSQLHALVLPSRTGRRWVEQFGRVLVEAMASGVPVIGSSSGEIPHVIGDAGLVYPEGDVAALGERLQSLIDDRALWQDLAQRGQERVRRRYTQARIAEETVKVYEEMMCPVTAVGARNSPLSPNIVL